VKAPSLRNLGVALLLCVATFASAREVVPQSPAALYGELFDRVQRERVFPDSKTFADAIAKSEPAEILRRYADARAAANFSLRDFVMQNFTLASEAAGEFRTTPREEVRAHISRLWPALTRTPGDSSGPDSHLVLSTRYVVPGGRYRELYYWDSYFTMVGLQASGRDDLVADMVENFAGLIDRYGHIPNGSRSYYLSRSQPPFFAAMVSLQADRDGERALIQRLPQLELEYAFWMDGAEKLEAGTQYRRVVRLADGTLLNRYWDDLATPRDEGYVEDLAAAQQGKRPAAEVYRDLRAAAESGWDFSSRWLEDGKTLATIRTTQFLPVDLNSLLYGLETTIVRGCKAAQRRDCEESMSARAIARRQAIAKLMWDEKLGAFVDYDWRNGRRMEQVTAATAYPLFADLAAPKQVRRVAATLRATLLMPHGLATTTRETGQQWDVPNGWAPLQWIAIDGLRRNGEQKLAADIAAGWVAENVRVYCKTGKLVEKYNVRDAGAGAGGEYPVQDGFGWTNAVLVKLLALYPKLAGQKYEYTGGACATRDSAPAAPAAARP
jgi:alpha,alpha-trehalase